MSSPSLEAASAPQIAVEPISHCPVCGAASAQPWRSDLPDWEQESVRQRFSIRRCPTCDARFLDPRPLESELDKLYFPGYGPHQATPPEAGPPPAPHAATRLASLPLRLISAALVTALPDRLPRILDETYAPPHPGAALLDYGCGSAAFLDRARERGWSTIGADYAPSVIAGVTAAGHRGALIGGLDDAVPDGAVDLIRLNHVVEHLFQPGETLGQLRRKLRAGGRIHLATPNPASTAAAVLGRHWFPLDSPRHSVLYPPRTLVRALEAAGFRDCVVHFERTTRDMARSWGTVLYERRRIPHAGIAAIGDEPVRAAALQPLAVLAALARRSERIHVIARA